VYRLLTCLTTEHDHRIVLIAVLICAATAVTTFRTYEFALQSTDQRRHLWLAITGLCAASGIWGTHFIAMLAYQPRVPAAYHFGLTALSLLLASLAAIAGFAIGARKAPWSNTLGGSVIGAGIAVMHFTGMQALEVSGHLEWDFEIASIATLLGTGFAIAALTVFHEHMHKYRSAFASGLLVLAIAFMHFTAMSAAHIQPDPSVTISALSIDRVTLAMALFLVTAIALAAGVVAVFVQKVRDQLELRTADLQSEAAKRRDDAERLNKQQAILGALMSHDTFRHGTLEAAIAVLNQHATRYTTIASSYLYLCNEDNRTLKLFQIHDRAPGKQLTAGTVPATFFDADGIIDRVTAPIVIPDTKTDPRLMANWAGNPEAFGLCAAMFNPVVANGRVAGILSARANGSEHVWSQSEILFATSLANMASLVFERHEREKIEDELRLANASALAANKAKSQFLANMSHEIRTPMNGVFGMTDLLARTSLDERQRRLVGSISQSARTLLTIINDILDLSRIEEGKLLLDCHDFDLAGCIEDSVALLADDAQRKGLDLNIFIDEQAVGAVMGDSVRLRQVMLNLIGNAVKFTAKGEVVVRVTPSSAASPAKGFRFEVRDTGIGIDSHVLGKLFNPFTQADASISRRFGGTGLGLSISQHLVSLMGGKMHIASEPSRGTCVSFELPMDIKPAPEARTKNGSAILAGQRILVVDDRATNREIVCSYLAACGVQAESAEGGAQALAMLKAAADAGQPFVQAIVDLLMPGMDGLELCRRISSDSSLRSPKLILLSSLSWSQDLGQAREAGVERLLHKPIRRNELIGVATELLTRHAIPAGASGSQADVHRAQELNLKILVAEDNPVNQVIAAEYLANLGCAATVVENGLQALAAFEREHYDVILMDCQMPEMDGLSAAIQIRVREKETGQPATPIIAITANAFEEDRQRCLESGMNGYVRKPFSETELAAAISEWRPKAGTRPSASVTTLPIAKDDKPACANDIEMGAEACGTLNDDLAAARPALHAKLSAVYLEHTPGLAAVISRALRAKDMNALMLAAHSLKSSSANIGALRLSELCKELEAAATANAHETCAKLVPVLERGLDLLMANLKVKATAKSHADVA
jgi:signal transduction histidine kinase/CheY-like chemotaxis protein/NO-binding membrane sensor protein with MHYT domain